MVFINRRKIIIMNITESDILNILLEEPYINQRVLSASSGHSVGLVNSALRKLEKEGYLNKEMQPTQKARTEVKTTSPKNAIILAAGFGMRMVPINTESPKALLEVDGEVLIERIIRQLHEVGIREIYVVVGFMKERFEYLIDQYGVRLICNSDYAKKNNLHSLRLTADYIDNTYIIPCDIWCVKNPFSRNELYSWYMVSDLVDDDSSVRVNRKRELVSTDTSHAGNQMIGIAYLTGDEAGTVREKLVALDQDRKYENDFWETTLFQEDRMILAARVVPASDFIEINTYEQLRDLDEKSDNLKSDALETIAHVFETSQNEVKEISVLKKGMTNRSFLFSCKGQKYIMRIPGEGTDQLINRKEEADVYHAISGKGLCDDPVYMNPENGYKITKFLEGVRSCDPDNEKELWQCMRLLKILHDMNLQVDHTFDVFGQINFYESLWKGAPSIYRDYQTTKEHVFRLKSYIDSHKGKWCLSHIDANCDNFLFYQEDGQEKLQLTDWEYAGMQDPYVDIAMFAIYSYFDKEKTDHLIDIYFDGRCNREDRIKIYCYVSVCGLLWSNWCEYKSKLGVEFGEYSLAQYRYAKDFYRIVEEELSK
jgi:CTP:phosphocholine cytidylyltransferase-like protein/thiamine kinase-like enzyme